jgi:YesN/AraC family two-component response regulator
MKNNNKNNNKKKILIVDDIEFMLKFEETLLNSLSKELSITIVIDKAKTLKEARKYLENTEYDVMVVDINLPDGSGMELVKELRGQNKVTRIAVLSIYPYSEVEESASVDAFYTKPLSPLIYKENIKKLLGLV